MKKIILASLMAMGLAPSVYATVTAQSGIYVNGNLGWSFPSTWDTWGVNNGENLTKTNRGYTAGAVVGYDYALNQNFLIGAETGYTYFGKTNYDLPPAYGSSLNAEEQGIQVLLTGTYLNQNGFNVFGKAGAVYLSEKLSGDGGFTGSNTVNQWEPALAAGVGYMFIQNLNLTLQYEHIFGQNSSTLNADTTFNKPQSQNTVTLGLTYKFGNAS